MARLVTHQSLTYCTTRTYCTLEERRARLRPQRGPLARVLVGRVDYNVVIDHDVEAIGGQRADDVEEAVVHAVVGQLLVADAVRRAIARDGLCMMHQEFGALDTSLAV